MGYVFIDFKFVFPDNPETSKSGEKESHEDPVEGNEDEDSGSRRSVSAGNGIVGAPPSGEGKLNTLCTAYLD